MSTQRPRFDRTKYFNASKYQRYLDNQGREILAERRVELKSGEYEEFQQELNRRKWQKLAQPESQYNEELIREFYANAYPVQMFTKRRQSWVRGKQISYSRNTINEYLGNPCTPEEDEIQQLCSDEFDILSMASVLCIPGGGFEIGTKTQQPTILKRSNMTTITQI